MPNKDESSFTDLWSNNSQQPTWRVFSGADLCCPLAGPSNNITISPSVSGRVALLPCRKDSVGMKKAAAHIPSRVMNFRNQKLHERQNRPTVTS